MSKALRFIIEPGPNETRLCCMCAERDAMRSGAPCLYFMAAKVEHVDGCEQCQCGRLYGGAEAFDAAGRIAQYIK